MFDRFVAIDSEAYVAAFLLQCFFFLAFYFTYKFSCHKIIHKNFYLSNAIGYSLIVILIAYLYFTQSTGVGLAGSDFKFESFSAVNIIFIILQPDFLFLVLAPFLRSKKIFLLCCSVYLVSTILRGWLGGIIFTFVIYLIRYNPVYIKRKIFIYFCVLLFGLLLLLPIFTQLKWGIRSGLAFHDIVDRAFQSYSSQVFFEALNEVIGRFQHVDYVALLYKEQDFYFSHYWDGAFRSFWHAGLPYNVYCRIFDDCKVELNIFFVENSLDYGNQSWNVDPGVAGWFFVTKYMSPVFTILVLLVNYLAIKFFYKNYGSRGALLVSFFGLVFLFHGWISAYVNFLLCFLLVHFVSKKWKKIVISTDL